MANKLLVRYVDVPREAKFRLDAKDRAYWTGDTVRLSTDLDMDQFGVRVLSLWTIVSAEEIVPGEVVEYVAQDTTLYGRYWLRAQRITTRRRPRLAALTLATQAAY